MSFAQLPLASKTTITGHIIQQDNDLSEKSTTNSCNICYTEELDNIVFLPCFHHLCYDCFEKLTKPKCPWCRHEFSNNILRSTQHIQSTQHVQSTPHVQNNQNNQNIINSEYFVEQQIFRIENRIAQRERQLQRRYRNKQRQLHRKQQRQLVTNEFYDFFIIFHQSHQSEIGHNQSSNGHNHSSNNISSSKRHKKPNHRTSKQPDSRISILQIR